MLTSILGRGVGEGGDGWAAAGREESERRREFYAGWEIRCNDLNLGVHHQVTLLPQKGRMQTLCAEDVATSKDVVNVGKSFGMPEQPTVKKENTVKMSVVPKATHKSAHMEQPASLQNLLLNEEL
ncbi:hypothetical protein Droror1_Dr00026244 [Drosera rotundifolia]